MATADPAFASFEEKWLQANPEQRVVAVFLEPRQRRLVHAFGKLVHELEQAIFDVREPQVAAAKLDWWHHELAAAATGNARHPVSRELFAQIAIGRVEHSRWAELIGGGLALLDPPSAPSLDAVFNTLSIFYRPVAAIESAVLDADSRQNAANADLWISSHLLRSVALLERSERRQILPLDLLARHGLTRATAARPGAERAGLLRDYLNAVGERLDSSLIASTRASVGRRVRARLDRDLAAKAGGGRDPLAFLGAAGANRWRTIWYAWREARHSRARTDGGGLLTP